MSGPIARFLAQALLIGGGVIIKAFAEAYQRVAANPEAARAAAEAAKKQGAKSGGVLLRKQMAEREALMVLNFEKRPQSREELRERYRKYFEANDPKRGGSLYLQSKVYRANEAIERAMGLAPEPVPPAASSSSSSSDANKKDGKAS